MRDNEIMDSYPEVLCSVQRNYRWLPLRMALEEFSKLGLDTLFMNSSGLFVRTLPNYIWYAWKADTIVKRRNAGLYGVKLMYTLRHDIKRGRSTYTERPDFS